MKHIITIFILLASFQATSYADDIDKALQTLGDAGLKETIECGIECEKIYSTEKCSKGMDVITPYVGVHGWIEGCFARTSNLCDNYCRYYANQKLTKLYNKKGINIFLDGCYSGCKKNNTQVKHR